MGQAGFKGMNEASPRLARTHARTHTSKHRHTYLRVCARARASASLGTSMPGGTDASRRSSKKRGGLRACVPVHSERVYRIHVMDMTVFHTVCLVDGCMYACMHGGRDEWMAGKLIKYMKLSPHPSTEPGLPDLFIYLGTTCCGHGWHLLWPLLVRAKMLANDVMANTLVHQQLMV